MREFAERTYFVACLAFGRLLRAGRYSEVQIVRQSGEVEVRKYRSFYAPLLVRLGDPLVRMLDTGVFVLPQREWVERERMIYRSLRDSSIHVDADGRLVLPYLAGDTLAALLDNPGLDGSVREKAVELAADALSRFHRLGLTHGDALAENVMVNLDEGVAHWFDFETIHDASRPLAWRRADDVRALLSTCLVRTAEGARADTLRLILDVYADETVTRLLATSFSTVLQRSLTFHLGQAGLSLQGYRDIARLVEERQSAR